jgi:hypothetical protein
MSKDDVQLEDRIERLRSRYPGKSDQELMAIRRFLDRYIEIALSIYLEATEPSSRETQP